MDMLRTKVVTGKRGKYILRWYDDQARKWRERSTDLDCNEVNRGKAHQLLAKLRDELIGAAPPNLTLAPVKATHQFDPNADSQSRIDGAWEAYLNYFKQNHLAALSDGYRSVLIPIVGRFHEFTKVKSVQDINTPMIRRWVSQLQQEGLATATIHSYWGHLSSFLRIAVEDGLIKAVPKIRLPKIDRRSMSKGRALSGEEFERMLAAVDTCRPKQAIHWKRVLRGLWFGGLRIGEAYRLTFDASDFSVDLDRHYPVFVIKSAGQKSRRSQTLPMAPELADLLQETPANRRTGRVFRFLSEAGEPLLQPTVEKTISEFGRKAKIKVGAKKTASAHDLRRSFGSRWALKVMPQVLQQLMRHADIQTTMRFYVDLKSDDLGAVIYKNSGRQKEGKGDKPSTDQPTGEFSSQNQN